MSRPSLSRLGHAIRVSRPSSPIRGAAAVRGGRAARSVGLSVSGRCDLFVQINLDQPVGVEPVDDPMRRSQGHHLIHGERQLSEPPSTMRFGSPTAAKGASSTLTGRMLTGAPFQRRGTRRQGQPRFRPSFVRLPPVGEPCFDRLRNAGERGEGRSRRRSGIHLLAAGRPALKAGGSTRIRGSCRNFYNTCPDQALCRFERVYLR